MFNSQFKLQFCMRHPGHLLSLLCVSVCVHNAQWPRLAQYHTSHLSPQPNKRSFLHSRFRGAVEEAALLDLGSSEHTYASMVLHRLLHTSRLKVNRQAVLQCALFVCCIVLVPSSAAPRKAGLIGVESTYLPNLSTQLYKLS